MSNKIIRTICVYSEKYSEETLAKIDRLSQIFLQNDFEIQTKRICLADYNFEIDDQSLAAQGVLLGMGAIKANSPEWQDFLQSENKSVFLDLSQQEIDLSQVDSLFEIISLKPENTFNFTFGFNTPASSPYFPSAQFEKEGFSIGLQPTDLAEGCASLEDWLLKMQNTWNEILMLLKNEPDFLGIDSSIAPIFAGKGSLVNFIKSLRMSFEESVTTDIYTKITRFIKENNPKPIGLCGLMLPCLEDFELADEYELGHFSIERNIFLSLHSGLGIDTYPIGIDEKPERVLKILQLVQALSNKYSKPLSARFVSDGKAKIGEKTDFKNQYLKDVVVRAL